MIYCVEDEKNIRELLIYTLETTGFSAKGMANAKELRTALKEELPDLSFWILCFQVKMATVYWKV